MTKITVSEAWLKQLGEAEDVIELCDESGRTLGHFVPATGMIAAAAEDNCPYTEAELAQMRAETGAELWPLFGRAWGMHDLHRGLATNGGGQTGRTLALGVRS